MLKCFSVDGADPSNSLALIDANEAAIEAGAVVRSYTAPGQGHGILEFGAFYNMKANGVKRVDSLNALLEGKPLEDVHGNE